MLNLNCLLITGSTAASLTLIIFVILSTSPALAGPDENAGDNREMAFCSQTAEAAFIACGAEINDDFWITNGSCVNQSDPTERRACRNDARTERGDGEQLCEEQLEARLEVCSLIGEERFDPDFEAANFVDPAEIGNSVEPNPYFPLVPGTQWVLEGGDETITVAVTDRTKLIDDVTCRVVNDVVRENGMVIEDTDDWYAQDLEGNVWYFGEIAMDFETFEGDDPEEPELVAIDGSWKAGRKLAKPGILLFAAPQVGVVHREEISLGEAEDMAEVLSITGTESVRAGSCNNDCLVTRNFTPIEPGIEETKYYAPGMGLILEIDMEGNRTELVEFTTP